MKFSWSSADRNPMGRSLFWENILSLVLYMNNVASFYRTLCSFSSYFLSEYSSYLNLLGYVLGKGFVEGLMEREEKR